MNLELEVVQPIYVQKNNDFWACRMVSNQRYEYFQRMFLVFHVLK